MGRPRKPTSKHLADGTLHVTRHASRMREPKFDGQPVKPKGMSLEAQRHWDEVVPSLEEKGVAKGIDASALRAMCEAWAEYQTALRMMPKTLEDKAHIAVCGRRPRRGDHPSRSTWTRIWIPNS